MDHKLTEQLQDWLNNPHDSAERIQQGAELLLKFNRNKILYGNIIRNPLRPMWKAKIEYELKKYLTIRLNDMTQDDVKRMEARVMLEAATILKEATVPEGVEDPDENTIQLKGIRADHDKLPKEIQQLWDSNKSRWKKIAKLHATLRGMEKAEPCDRFELLKQMDELDTQYRKKMQEYDEYVLEELKKEEAAPAETETEAPAEQASEAEQSEEQPTADDTEAAKLEVGKHRTWLTRNMDKLKRLYLMAHAEQPSALDVQMWEDFVVETNGHISEVYRLGTALTNKRIIELRQAGCTVGELGPLA